VATGSGLTMTYDEANRVASATVRSSGTEYYGYDAEITSGFTRCTADGSEEWTFYGAKAGRSWGRISGWWKQCTDLDGSDDLLVSTVRW
jgi:hypothetical protein